MRSFILIAATAATLLSTGCWVGSRERPVARYSRPGYVRVGPPPPRYYERREYYGDDRGYRRHHDYRYER